MSVMVIENDSYIKLYQFLCNIETVNMDGADSILGVSKYLVIKNLFYKRHRDTVIHLYKLNVMNYCIKYNEEFMAEKLNFDKFLPNIDKKEAIDIVRSIRYNICDNFDTDDADYLIQYIENNL